MAGSDSSGPGQTALRQARLKALLLPVLLGLALLAAWWYGFLALIERPHLLALLARVGPWAPLLFGAVKVLTVTLALPSAPVTMAGGYLFGFLWGTVINVVAASTGAMLTFFIGRYLGQDAVQGLLKGKLKEMDEGLTANGLWYMLFLRLVPLFPFNGINYGAGLTRVSFRDYALGTVIGITPGAAVFTYLGDAIATVSPWKIGIAFSLLGLLSLLPVILKRLHLSPQKGDPDDAPPL
jgi:uncharacterized membrane protein YdjX (TVP38/TMEM64 family)